jgi:hypothetical protein
MASPLAATFQPILDTSSPLATDGMTCQMSNTSNVTCIQNTSESHVACYAVIGVIGVISVVTFLTWVARRYNIKRPAFLGGSNTQPVFCMLKGSEEALKAIAYLDTGAEGGNFISQDFLLRLGYGVNELGPSKDCWNCFNNETVHSLGTISLRWCAEGSREIRTTDFHVIGSAPFEMVLGAKFCVEERLVVRNNKALLLVKNKKKPSKGEVLNIRCPRSS